MQILNVVMGAVGKTVVFGPDHNVGKLARFQELSELVGKMRGGEVGVLLVHDSNPAYSAPQVGLADALRSGNVFTVSFAYAPDETAELADLVLPDHAAFEAWGDAEPVRGIKTIQQPTIRPRFDTRATVDVLLDAARALGANVPAGQLPRAAVRGVGRQAGDGRRARARRRVQGSAGHERRRSRAASAASTSSPRRSPATRRIRCSSCTRRTTCTTAGSRACRRCTRFRTRSPRPCGAATPSSIPRPPTVLDVEMGDVLEISTDAGKVRVAAFPHQAVRPGVIALQVGRGTLPRDPNAPLEPHSAGSATSSA